MNFSGFLGEVLSDIFSIRNNSRNKLLKSRKNSHLSIDFRQCPGRFMRTSWLYQMYSRRDSAYFVRSAAGARNLSALQLAVVIRLGMKPAFEGVLQFTTQIKYDHSENATKMQAGRWCPEPGSNRNNRHKPIQGNRYRFWRYV